MATNYPQGDVVFLKKAIILPNGKELPHPILIVSSNRANEYEDFYTGIMMTSSSITDAFSFKLDDTMFEGKLDKSDCQLRLYIIISFRGCDISTFKNRMNPIFIKLVLKQLNSLVFS